MTPWGGRTEYRSTTSSTMDDAQALEDSGAPDGSLVQAGFQTAGRGRYPDRSWVSAPDENLLFTVYWSPNRFRVPEFAPSLTVGLGLCLWLEALDLGPRAPVSLKWPNDVYLGDQKVAGILVRRRWTAGGPRSVHAGIGVNLKPTLDPSGFRTPAANLADFGFRQSPAEALDGLLHALAVALDHPDPRGACESRMWRRGADLELNLPGGRDHGVVVGLDPEGQLVWDTPRGRQTVSSGE
jgi:BirA family biotin operon repressor/biotin-[acetyl-CoA-carboxylase] ligase